MTYAKESGYILITTTIVIFSIGALASFSILFFALTTVKNNTAFEASQKAKAVANGCAELGIQRVAATPTYTGTTTAVIGTGNCSYVVSQPNGTTSQIIATGTVNTVVRKVQITMNRSPVSVTRWQEIP